MRKIEDYADILLLPHHKAKNRKEMSLKDRAAQFAPFAALTGYEEAVTETAREVGERIDIDDELRNILDSKIQMLSEQIKKKHEIVFTYFVPDLTKDGGKYINITGIIKKIDTIKQLIILEDKTEIPINEIIDISGEVFKVFE